MTKLAVQSGMALRSAAFLAAILFAPSVARSQTPSIVLTVRDTAAGIELPPGWTLQDRVVSAALPSVGESLDEVWEVDEGQVRHCLSTIVAIGPAELATLTDTLRGRGYVVVDDFGARTIRPPGQKERFFGITLANLGRMVVACDQHPIGHRDRLVKVAELIPLLRPLWPLHQKLRATPSKVSVRRIAKSSAEATINYQVAKAHQALILGWLGQHGFKLEKVADRRGDRTEVLHQGLRIAGELYADDRGLQLMVMGPE